MSDNHGAVNSYQATAYLGFAPGPWFANVALVYGLDDYSGSRHVMFTGINSTVTADYKGHQYAAYGTTGYHFYLGDRQTVLTPVASLQYTRLHTSGYTEAGDPGINLTVNAQNYNFTQSGLGAKLARYVPLSDRQVIRPEIHVNWLHAFGNETMRNTAAFASGGPAFTVVGLQPKRDTWNVGAGVLLANNGRWSVESVYDYQWRGGKYSAQQAMIRFALHM